MMGIGQRGTPEFTSGSSRPGSNPVKDIGSFLETLEHIHDHFGPKAIENHSARPCSADNGRQTLASQDARDDSEKTEGKTPPVSDQISDTESPNVTPDPEKQVHRQPFKTEVRLSEPVVDKQEAGLSEVGLSEPITDFEAEVIVLRRKVLEKDSKIESLKCELELLKKDKEKAEERKKEAEDIFLKISEDYDQIVDLYEIIYNHFHLGDAGVNSPEGIISPLDCRQGNLPMKREKQRGPPS